MTHLMRRARFILVLTILVLVSAARADASPTIQVASTLCPGGTGVATLSPPDGGGSWASVQWSITNGTIVSTQGSSLTFWNQSSAPITIGASATAANSATFTAAPVTVVVHQTTPPDLDTKGSVCIGGNGTAVVRNATSYPSPISWQVTNGVITANHGASIEYTAGTSGYVYILASSFDANGCYVAAQWQVIIVPQPSAEISVSPSACPGAFEAMVPDGGVNALYDWSIANGAIIAGAGTRQIMFVPADGNDVTLEATVTEYYRGCSNHGTYTGQFVPGDGPQIELDRTSACPGSPVHASISGTYASVNWSVTNGWITQDDGNSITFQISGGEGPAQVAVSVSDGPGCSAYDAEDIAVSSIDPPTLTVDKSSVCPGVGVVTATVDGDWANVYWSVLNGEVLSQNGNTATVRSTNWSSGIELGAWVTDAAGCSALSNSVQIPLRTINPPTITLDKTSVCPGQGVVTATVDGDWANVYWSVLNGEILNESGNTVTVRSTSWMAGIELGAWVTDTEGCSALTNSVQIPLRTINPPAITLDKTSVCPGQGVVTATVDGEWTNVYWSVINGEILNQSGNTVTVRSTGWMAGIELGAWVTDAEGCSALTNSVQIPLRTIEPPAITVDKPSVCPGQGVVTATIEGQWINISWSALNGEILSQDGNTVTVRSTNWSSGIELTAYVFDAEGCSTTANSVQIPLRTIEAPVIAVDKPSVCPGQGVVTATIEGEWTYIHWSALNGELLSQNGNTVMVRSTNWTSGIELTAYVFDAEGCSTTTNSVQIPLRSAPAVTAGGPTTFCEGGSVILTAPEGMAAYAWSNGATTASITVTASGSYSVTTTDADACALTSMAVMVTVNPLPAATITAGGPTTLCEGGSVTLTAPESNSYSWSTGAMTRSIAADASGAYSVTVTNANGCPATSAPVVVTENPLPATPVITAGGPTAFCEGGSVTLTAPAGFTYLWSTGAATQSIVATAAGSYTVTVTDGNGCTATSAATSVTVNPLPVATITAGGATTFCEGGSVTLTASAGSSYLWSNGATTQSTVVSAGGSYSVTVTNANGCSATSAATAVTVNALPTPTIAASGPTTFCEGGSVTLTASAGSSYLWSNGATTPAIDVTSGGNYSVTVTNAAGCSATSASTAVTVNALPAATITASGPTTFCEGGSVTLTASAGSSYLWSTGATTQAIDVTSGGNYSVTVTNAAGCSATSAATAVTVNALPTATITPSGPTTFCAGGSVTMTASSGSSYLWSNGATTQAINVTSSGNYSVTVTNAAGCSATSTATAVTVNAPPTATITPSGPTTFCEGGSVTLTASAGSSYLWSNGATTQAINVTSSGNYSVTVTNAAGCSATSTATAVTVNAPPTATITPSGPTTFCAGGSVTLTASAGSSYLWSTGATTQAINVTSSGSYSVTVTNAAGCSATSTATAVTVNAPPTATITPSGPTTFCTGGSVTLTASAGSSYLWSTGATTQGINVTSSGNYSVTVTNAAGCSATSTATTVTVNALPTATITPSGPTTFCTGGSVTLTASAGSSYLWSTGATTQAINVTSSGNYSVTVTNAAGCSTTSAATAVTMNALPTATITPSGPTTFCTGGSVTLTASAGSSYLWSTGATTQAINVTSSGNYTVTVTNAAGCSATSAPRSVTVNANPSTPVITAGGPTTFCAGGSVTLTAPAGFTYLWSNGATTQSINATTGGNYTVTVTNAGGCSAISAATSVTVNAATTIGQQPQSQTIPKNTTATLSVTASGTGTLTYQWYKGTSPSTTQPISGATSSSYTTPKLTKGTYTYWVRVTGTCGVANSTTATISVP